MIKNNRTCVDNEALIKIYIKLVLCIAAVCIATVATVCIATVATLCDTLLVYIS